MTNTVNKEKFDEVNNRIDKIENMTCFLGLLIGLLIGAVTTIAIIAFKGGI